MNATDTLKANLGRFRISESLTKEPWLMACFFEHFRPIRFELSLYDGIYYMLCESVMFETIDEGMPIPEYVAEFLRDPRTEEISFRNLTKAG